MFAVTKEGAWLTVLQHGEGRREGPQQGGRGGDGIPILFDIHANVGILAFLLNRLHHVFFLYPLGATRLPSMSLAAGPDGPWGAVYRGLPPPGALLDARVVRQIHLQPYHSP